MSDNLEAYLQSYEPLCNDDYTSLQRQALGEVLRLSSEIVGPIESRMQQDRQAAKEQIQRRFDTDKAKIDADLQTQSRKSELQRDARIEKAEADCTRQVNLVEAEAQNRRSQVEHGAAELQSKAEKEWQDKELVADFVGEGAVEKTQKQRFETKSVVQKTNRYLDDLAAQADGWLRLYRQPVGRDRGEHKSASVTDPHTADYRQQKSLAEQHLNALSRLRTARLFVGAYPFFLAGGIFVTVLAVLAIPYLLRVPGLPSILVTGLSASGLTIVLIGAGGYVLWKKASRQAQHIHGLLHAALGTARAALVHQRKRALHQLDEEYQSSIGQKQAELQQADDTLEAAKMTIIKHHGTLRREIEDQRQKSLDRVKQQRNEAVSEAQQEYTEKHSAPEHQSQTDLAQIKERYDDEMAACERGYVILRRSLEERWDKGLACVQTLLQRTADLDKRIGADWDNLLTESWKPSEASPSGVSFGRVQLDLRLLSETVLARAEPALDQAESVSAPVMLEFPGHCSMLLQYEREGRQQAIEALRAVMLRLFTSLPPGRINFTIVDPVALGESFAGFMHAADYLQALVGGARAG